MWMLPAELTRGCGLLLQMYLHLTDHWDANPNNPNNPNSYLNSSEFHDILVNSVFTVCPRGHSVEQFRIYEAIEAGSIPILELADGYTASHVPPEYARHPCLELAGRSSTLPPRCHAQSDKADAIALL